MDLGETVPSVCSVTRLNLSVDGNEVSDRVKEVLQTQEEEEDHLAISLLTVKATDKVCYLCNIVVLTVVQQILTQLMSSVSKTYIDCLSPSMQVTHSCG